MNRLTIQGVTYGSCEFMDDGIHEWINRLAAYEDTELTPEEIKILKDFRDNNKGVEEYFEICVAKDKAIADRDYWKAEALKHCAKLGEIKLLIGRSEG